MKNTGIVRNLDSLGRITLPIELRKTLKITEEDPIEIYVYDDIICLKKLKEEKICATCGTDEYLMDVDGIYICGPCGRGIANAIAKEHLKRRG